MQIEHRVIQSNGLSMYVAGAERGPVALPYHGFPESWYSWRHQLVALARAGYHAVAAEQRGYGETEQPEAIEQYTLFQLLGDMVGLLDALGEPTAVIAGHDWGAPVAWHSALVRPDCFRGVIGLSEPFRPRGTNRPTAIMPQHEQAQFYQLYFQQPGIAEAEPEHDVRTSLRKLHYRGSSDPRPRAGKSRTGVGMVPRGGGFLTGRDDPATLPAWLADADLEHDVSAFEASGFRGGLNWYRNIDRNWELLAPWAGARVEVLALYVAGDRDLVVAASGGSERLFASLARTVPKLLHDAIILPGCGHWTQQERANEVNAAMLGVLDGMH